VRGGGGGLMQESGFTSIPCGLSLVQQVGGRGESDGSWVPPAWALQPQPATTWP